MLEEIGILIFKSLWLFCPAYAANASPYAVRGIKFLSKPINEKLLGKNKTWRGFLFAILVAMAVAYVQSFIKLPSEYLVYNYDNPLILGFLLGLGAMSGDAIESFFKRKRNIAPGKSWFPFDQIDFIIGSYLIVLPLVFLPVWILVILLILTVPIHMLTNYVGYLLKIKKKKF